jgi:hypothetical protein
VRVLRIHAVGADPGVAAAVGDAVRAFNAALDIRLRFLSVGIEETVVETAADPDAAGAAAHLAGDRPDPVAIMILLGTGEAAVTAAAAALRAGVPVVRVGAGERSGPDADASRAVDHLCPVLLAWYAAGAEVLRRESAGGAVEVVGGRDDPETGARIVRAVTRARRRDRC